MKIRMGFVSNSSSSSYLAITTDDDDIIEQIEKLLGVKNYDKNIDNALYRLPTTKNPSIKEIDYGQYHLSHSMLTLFDGNEKHLCMVGLSIDEADLEVATLKELRNVLKDELIRLGIDIPIDATFNLCYGDWGNE